MEQQAEAKEEGEIREDKDKRNQKKNGKRNRLYRQDRELPSK